jgi:hypothetical protein
VYARLRLIFPVPVFLNRFAAPLFVFILGIKIPSDPFCLMNEREIISYLKPEVK